MTPAEKYLWRGFLRYYPVRFRRNRRIGGCTAAFYCARAKLAVALEHSPERPGDAGTECLHSVGIELIRFAELDVVRSFACVCLAIEEKVTARMPSHQAAASL